MPAFEYQALNARGRQKKGIIEADTQRHARSLIREKGLLPTEVKQLENKSQESKQRASAASLFNRRYRLKPKEIVSITRQLANLIQASLPVDEALRSIAEHNNANIRRVISATRARVVEGQSLSSALADQHIFDPQYASSIAAGEQSGELSKVLQKMADDTERNQQFYGKMKTAMIYPASIALVAISVVIALLTYVVPQVVEVFVNTNRALPTLTIIMISISDFLRHNAQLLIMLLLASLFTFVMLLRIKSFQRRWHRFVARIPVIGKIFIGSNNARFCRTFSLMQAAGVPVIESLRLSAQIVTSLPMQEGILTASELVREGSSIFRALQKQNALHP